MESAERAVKTRGMNDSPDSKNQRNEYSPDSKNQRNEIQEMKYSPEPLISSGLLNYVKADIRNPLRYSVKRFFCLYCTP